MTHERHRTDDPEMMSTARAVLVVAITLLVVVAVGLMALSDAH
jgi:hypothetical protein